VSWKYHHLNCHFCIYLSRNASSIGIHKEDITDRQDVLLQTMLGLDYYEGKVDELIDEVTLYSRML